ncbi:MAG: hypothetical protein IB618_00985 [Candidatus Pacearchaeota archaeon]|nr:MAG: hypothetical protein IB618_00985 [Candidatus Pacearchaeota archaeon]
MKIFICCSKHFYHQIPCIQEQLKKVGHELTFPNSYEDPFREEEEKKKGRQAHIKWKSEMIRLQNEKVKNSDAVLVLNFEKNGQRNYIGGATFLEIFKAFELGKKIFLFNPIPESIFEDELIAMNPIVLNKNLSRINNY